jgi:TonB family protein
MAHIPILSRWRITLKSVCLVLLALVICLSMVPVSAIGQAKKESTSSNAPNLLPQTMTEWDISKDKILSAGDQQLPSAADRLLASKADRSDEALDKAIADYSRAIKLNPDDYDAFVRRSECLAERKRYAEAIEDCNEAIGIKPGEIETYRSRYELNFAIGQFTAALHDATLAIELYGPSRSENNSHNDPDLGELYHNRGRAYSKLKMEHNAVIDYCNGSYLGDDEFSSKEQIRNFSLAPKLSASDWETPLHDAQTANQAGEYIEAVDQCEDALLMLPPLRHIDARRITVDFELAKAYQGINYYPEAFALYQHNRDSLEKLLGKDDLSVAFCDAKMALILYDQDLDDEAFQFYKRGMSLAKQVLSSSRQKEVLADPITSVDAASTDVVLLNNAAVHALDKNKPLLAIETLKKALKLDPQYKLAKENLAVAYNNYGLTLVPKYDLALKQFEKALSLDRLNDRTSSNLDSCIQLAGKNPHSPSDRIALGDNALHDKEFDRAIVEYAEALKIDVDALPSANEYYVPALMNLASYYADKGETTKGLSLISKVLERIKSRLPDKTEGSVDLSDVIKTLDTIVQHTQDKAKTSPILEKNAVIETKSETGSVAEEFSSESLIEKIKTSSPLAAHAASKGEVAAAKNFYKQIVTDCEGVEIDQHNRLIAESFYAAALFLDDQKEYEEATVVLTQALVDYLKFGWHDLNFSKYMSSIDLTIKANWHPPKRSASNHITVRFDLDRMGGVTNLKVEKSSGDSYADKAALNAIEAASPLPIPPSGSASPLQIEYNFDYRVHSASRIHKGGKNGDRLNTQLIGFVSDEETYRDYYSLSLHRRLEFIIG